jgi:hypothetical protein
MTRLQPPVFRYHPDGEPAGKSHNNEQRVKAGKSAAGLHF